MPPRLPTRIPKFTLYTGPQCSLCDDAKAALSRVRVMRTGNRHPKMGNTNLVSSSSSSSVQSEEGWRSFDLDIVNIRDEGQERWLRRYVYWIPVLHLDGKEVAKGRWGESEILKALDDWGRMVLEQEDGSNTG